MRSAAVAVLLVCLIATPALAEAYPAWVVVSATMDTIFDPVQGDGVAPSSHHRFAFTVRNDGGRDIPWTIGIDAWWYVEELPTSVWWEDVDLAPGETRSWVADVEGLLWVPPGPMWLCLRAEWGGNGWPTRCWSVLVGVQHPDGIYPETVPWPLIPTQAYGDLS